MDACHSSYTENMPILVGQNAMFIKRVVRKDTKDGWGRIYIFKNNSAIMIFKRKSQLLPRIQIIRDAITLGLTYRFGSLARRGNTTTNNDEERDNFGD